MKIKLNLTSEDILEKKFEISLKGYDMNEVDFFFDLIRKDYEGWELTQKQQFEIIEELSKKNKMLEKRIGELKNHNNMIKKELVEMQEKGLGNLDIIKRLNKLEEK